MSRSLSRQHQAAGDLDLEVLAGVALDLLPQRHRGRPQRQRVGGAVAAGRRAGQKSNDRSCTCRLPALAPEACRFIVVALDHQGVDALVRQPIGDAGARDAAADHQRVDRLARQRLGLARPRHVGRHEVGVAAPFRLLDRERVGSAPAWPAGAARTDRTRRPRPSTCAPAPARSSGPGSGPCRRGMRASARPACRGRRATMPAQLARRHLLAAADDGMSSSAPACKGARVEQPPQRRLEARGPARACGARRRPRRRQPEVAAIAAAAIEPCARAACAPPKRAPSPIAKTSADAGAAVGVGHRLHRAVAARHEAMGAAQRARQFATRR